MTKSEELAQKIETKRHELGKHFADHTNEKGHYTFDTAGITVLNERETELKTLTEEHSAAVRFEALAADNEKAIAELKSPTGNLTFPGGHPKGGPDEPGTDRTKGLGKLFVDSKAYKGLQGRQGPEAEISKFDVKTLMSTGVGDAGGYPPQVLRSGVVVFSPQPQPALIDLVPQGTTNQNGYKYMLETVFNNTAAETAEGALAPEAQLKFAEELSPVVKIPVFIPITEEELADVDGIQDIVDQRLMLMLKLRLNSQIVVGNGTAPNLTGLFNTAGILTQAQTNSSVQDNIPDAVYKAMVKVMTVGFADPSGVWFNPLDWQTVRLLKTTFGQYIYGDPSQTGPTTIFGLPVAQHVSVTAKKIAVADFAGYTQLVYRSGIEFKVSDSHADYFVRGQLAIRAALRVAWVIRRASAICEVTLD